VADPLATDRPSHGDKTLVRGVTITEFHSNAPVAAGKPSKPYPEFPLFPHATGRWAKKIRGKLHYFGPWSDPDGALNKYLAKKDALHADRKPREAAEGTTIKELCNRFLNAKAAARDVTDEAKDQPAVDLMMGHEIPHMSTIYRERISDARLKAVSDHVRAWLFSSGLQDPNPPAGDRIN
jgi:hypothetical protein